MERMTAKKPANGEIETSQCSVTLEGFDRVCGAARIITTAGRKQWRDSHLISTNKQDEDHTHRSTTNLRRPFSDLGNIGSQLLERRCVRFRFRANKEIDTSELRQQSGSHQFTETPLNPIPGNDLVSVLGYHNAYSRVEKQRS